jgi:hypothetical protein
MRVYFIGWAGVAVDAICVYTFLFFAWYTSK